MTRLLILSFSPLASDARVLKQIRAFADEYEITTCGYGPSPDPRVTHVRVPDDMRVDTFNPKLILLRAHRAAYRLLDGVRWVRKAFADERRRFDIVLANDIEALPLALWLHPTRGVHADLHEYFPLLHEEHEPWMRRISPYYTRLCRMSLPHAASVTTVSRGLQRAYRENFGVDAQLVTNAAPYVEAEPTTVSSPIRLVHSGACLRNRRLQDTIEGVTRSRANVTLDMFLTPNHPDHLIELRAMAAESGGRVRVHDPVPYERLNDTLRGFDVGVFVLEPLNFGYRWALPNKLFDYVQARLGVLVGPSPETAEFVRMTSIGRVTEGFGPDAIARALDDLAADEVSAWKSASHSQAKELSAEPQIAVWRRAIDALRDGGGSR